MVARFLLFVLIIAGIVEILFLLFRRFYNNLEVKVRTKLIRDEYHHLTELEVLNKEEKKLKKELNKLKESK